MTDHDRQTNSWRKYTPCGCVLVMFVICIALPAIGWIVWSANAARLVEDELAKIREASEPIETADLDRFYVVPPGRADTTQLWIEVVQRFEDPAFGEAARDIPIVGDGPEIPSVDEDWEQLEAVAEFLEQYQDEVSKIHEAAALGGYARFDRKFEEGIAMRLTHIEGLRSAARMLMLEARVAAHRGDAASVAQSIHAIFATCHALEEDPILVSGLVRVALAGIAANELEIAIGSVEFSEADLEMLRKDLRSVDFQHSLERSLMGERVIGIMMFRNPGRYSLDEEVPFPVRANNEDLALYLSTFAKYLHASRQPYPQALMLSEQATSDTQTVAGGSQVNRLRYPFTNLLLPAVDSVFEANARGTGTIACADTSLAIEQYRRSKGSIPGMLTELVPDFLDAVPLDPMDGEPLRYLPNDDGYGLYSIGRNRVDDGGVMGDERLDEVFSVKLRTTNPTIEASK